MPTGLPKESQNKEKEEEWNNKDSEGKEKEVTQAIDVEGLEIKLYTQFKCINGADDAVDCTKNGPKLGRYFIRYSY